MSSTRLLTFILTIALTATALARDTRKELSVNLRFAPQEGVAASSPDLLPAVLEQPVSILLEDARGGDASVIGQGTNDDDLTFAIRASTDLIPFVHDTLKQVATGWGLKVQDDADRVLTIRVNRYHVDESNKAVGSVYAAEVKLTYVLTDPSGRKLLEGAASGSAHRYGRARSADNCNEVLSDSLKEAFANALSDPRLQEAWASGRAAGGTTGTAPEESVEERLRKLDDLLRKGLITKEEYQRKRAEILKDI